MESNSLSSSSGSSDPTAEPPTPVVVTVDVIDFKLTTQGRIECLKKISRQLLQALAILFCVIGVTVGTVIYRVNHASGVHAHVRDKSSAAVTENADGAAAANPLKKAESPAIGPPPASGPSAGLTPMMVFFIGVLGGYVSLQRRLKTFSDFDLHLIANSWIYTLLAPFVGGLLAILLLYIFVGGLFSGPLFPEFKPSTLVGDDMAREDGFISVFFVGAAPAAYGRLIFWSFVAGFSERFVLDVVSQFEAKAKIS